MSRAATKSSKSSTTSQASNALSYYRTMANDRCLFCRIISSEIPAKKVFEDDVAVAFHDINPQAPTHVLVVPRKHIASLDTLDESEAPVVGLTIHRVAQIARHRHLVSDGYRVVANNGEAARQTV